MIPFELGPVNITLVVVFELDLPLSEGLAMAISFLRASFDNRDALFGFSVNVSPSVERILRTEITVR